MSISTRTEILTLSILCCLLALIVVMASLVATIATTAQAQQLQAEFDVGSSGLPDDRISSNPSETASAPESPVIGENLDTNDKLVTDIDSQTAQFNSRNESDPFWDAFNERNLVSPNESIRSNKHTNTRATISRSDESNTGLSPDNLATLADAAVSGDFAGGVIGRNIGSIVQLQFNEQVTEQSTFAGSGRLTTVSMQGQPDWTSMSRLAFNRSWQTHTDSDNHSTVTILQQNVVRTLTRSAIFEDQTVSNDSTLVIVAVATDADTIGGTENFNLAVHQATKPDNDGRIQLDEITTRVGDSARVEPKIKQDISKQGTSTDDVSQHIESQTLIPIQHTTHTSDCNGIVQTAPNMWDYTSVFDNATVTVQSSGVTIVKSVSPSFLTPTLGFDLILPVIITHANEDTRLSFFHAFHWFVTDVPDITTQFAVSSVEPVIETTKNKGATAIYRRPTHYGRVTTEHSINTEVAIGKTMSLTGDPTNVNRKNLSKRRSTTASSSVDVTRTISSDEVGPGKRVTVTTEISGATGAVSTASSYDPEVKSAVIQSVTVNDGVADPIIAQATANGSTVTLRDVGANATVTITEELTVGDKTNVTYSIIGDVTTEEMTTELDPISVTVVEPTSVVSSSVSLNSSSPTRSSGLTVTDTEPQTTQSPTETANEVDGFGFRSAMIALFCLTLLVRLRN